MSIEVYHVSETRFEGELLGEAFLVTLHDPGTERAEGSLSGHRLPEGCRGVLEFTGRRLQRRVRVRIEGIHVRRSAGPGCEFDIPTDGLRVEYLDPQVAPQVGPRDKPLDEQFTIR